MHLVVYRGFYIPYNHEVSRVVWLLPLPFPFMQV
ncbi:Uncharacterised protein [Escherichia coli]|nr:Uncharacterised protein [Escherichia coli]